VPWTERNDAREEGCARRSRSRDEPHYEIAFGEGRACSLCGANVLGPDRDRHTRWRRALAEVLGLGWTDLSARPVDPALADAVVHPRGWAKVSRFVADRPGWRVVPSVPVGGAATLLIGAPGVVVVRAVEGSRADVRAGVLRVDGHLTDHVHELRAAVGRVRTVLGDRGGLPVIGVLVVLGALEGGDPDPPEVLAAARPPCPSGSRCCRRRSRSVRSVRSWERVPALDSLPDDASVFEASCWRDAVPGLRSHDFSRAMLRFPKHPAVGPHRSGCSDEPTSSAHGSTCGDLGCGQR
jgi:hypothetical protein